MVGIYPGTVIGPYERFLIIDHNTEPYDDLKPRSLEGAYLQPDFVMNIVMMPDFFGSTCITVPSALKLTDPRGTIIDQLVMDLAHLLADVGVVQVGPIVLFVIK